MRVPDGRLDLPRPMLTGARLHARPEWRLWAGVLVACGLLAGAVWGFQTQVERWIMRATFRAVREEEAVRDAEPKRIDDRFVGRWISAQGGRILISRSGVVWFEAGDLIGTGTFEAIQSSRFTFAGPGFQCTYDLAIKRDVSDWHLLDHTPATACPEGRFSRAFAF